MKVCLIPFLLLGGSQKIDSSVPLVEESACEEDAKLTEPHILVLGLNSIGIPLVKQPTKSLAYAKSYLKFAGFGTIAFSILYIALNI